MQRNKSSSSVTKRSDNIPSAVIGKTSSSVVPVGPPKQEPLLNPSYNKIFVLTVSAWARARNNNALPKKEVAD